MTTVADVKTLTYICAVIIPRMFMLYVVLSCVTFSMQCLVVVVQYITQILTGAEVSTEKFCPEVV